MKKLWMIAVLVMLSGCFPNYTKPYQMKDYSAIPPIELPVQKIVSISQQEAFMQLPHAENMMPITPERAVFNWAYLRLRANYKKPYTAEVIVKKATMIRTEEINTNLFQLNNYRYNLDYIVSVRIVNDRGVALREFGIEGHHMRTQPIRSSVQERDALFVEMLTEMENKLDTDLGRELKQNLIDV